jgi:hypothetical protein
MGVLIVEKWQLPPKSPAIAAKCGLEERAESRQNNWFPCGWTPVSFLGRSDPKWVGYFLLRDLSASPFMVEPCPIY